MINSILNNIVNNKEKVSIKNKPFPYIIIDDALPKEYYEELDKSFPKYNKIINNLNYQPNFVYRYNALQSLNDREIPEIWREFIKYHTSYKFVLEVLKTFKESIQKYYPDVKLPTMEDVGIRFSKKNNFNTDCQFVINTPTEKETSVIEPHLDNPKEFYAALFYMRNKDDDSSGGDLTSYSYKKDPIFYGKSRIKENNVNLVDVINYKENRVVIFLNTLFSAHGVTKKSISPHYRKYINIIGEFRYELFDFRKYLEN